MITAGIDKIAMYTSQYALALDTLAKARNVDPEKFAVGLGQKKMSVPPPGEDIITLGANAAMTVLEGEDRECLDMVLFATESCIDQSKAAAVFLHELLELPAHCRALELKQACYGATAGLQLAISYLKLHPERKILLVASDVARYGLKSPGESSQGAGAIAMLLSASPRILVIEPEFGVHTESVMDFWRPNYLHEALVDGKYSSKLYLTSLEKSWLTYRQKSDRCYQDHDYFCYHTPVPRLVEKADAHLKKINGVASENDGLQTALKYCRETGNSYTASLYLSLLSLLEQSERSLDGKRIGFYSYGSGSVAEFFSGIVQSQYQSMLHRDKHTALLEDRVSLSYEQYEAFYKYEYNQSGLDQLIPDFKTGAFRLAKLSQHKRVYAKVVLEEKNNVPIKKKQSQQRSNEAPRIIRIEAPGKLILSGEHAVVHGGAALALAINRYVTAEVSHEPKNQFNFIFNDLAHQSRLSIASLHLLKDKIKRKYQRFVRGDFSIREVLAKPFELAQFALGILAETLDLTVPNGAKIELKSNIPIGCGLGSSAATIVSVIEAVSKYANLSLTFDERFQLALQAEKAQHGQTSGFDLQVALQGGCLHLHQEVVEKKTFPEFPLYFINTGTPESSTGECVTHTRKFFQSSSIVDDFNDVVAKMDQALQGQSWQHMQEAIRENHQLLARIGVVPENIKKFIHYVEDIGGAAKVCGAGSVQGEKAGVVLLACQDHERLKELCRQHHFQLENVQVDHRGVHAAA